MPNREIKYRAYVKILRMMFEVSLIVRQDWKIDEIRCDFPENEWDPFEYKLEDVELMQYTGIKDKNWVDIYEGDIIENDYAWYRYTILWDEERKYHCILNEKLLKVASLKDWFREWNKPSDFTVIWNIYENKNLLE